MSTKYNIPLLSLFLFAFSAITGFASPPYGSSKPAIAGSKINAMGAEYLPPNLKRNLLESNHFDALHFVIDDSASMGLSLNQRGQRVCRWTDALQRLNAMLDILESVPVKRIIVSLHSTHEKMIDMIRDRNQGPQKFIKMIKFKIDEFISRGPRAGSLLSEAIKKSLALPGRIARFFIGDFVTEHRIHEIERIEEMIEKRPHPLNNPITFIVTSDNEYDFEWISKLAEKFPNVATVFGGYQNKAAEVRRIQVDAFPYSERFNLRK